MLALLGFLPRSSSAATPLSQLAYSPDITIALSGTTVRGGAVATDNLSGSVSAVDLGVVLPTGAHVAAYHVTPEGDRLLVFDTTVSLTGLTASPRDVVRVHKWNVQSRF